MIKRRLIRFLTPYSKTFYFVDRGVQRGLVYDIGEILERDLNKRLNTGNVKVHVAIIPMPQSEFIPALRWGRGDIAMGNLTVTSERAKRVDFSDPAMKDVAEIVVTGARGSADRGRPLSEADERVEKSLRNEVSLRFDNAPLSEVVKYLGKQGGLNIVLNRASLADATVTPETPVTINVDRVRVKSALNLLLEPPSEVGLVAPVVSFMTRDVVTIPLDTPLDTAAHMMQAAGLRRLPVVDGDRVVGIVSRRDLMRVVREMRRQSNFEMLPDAEFAD